MNSPVPVAQVTYRLAVGGSEVLAWQLARGFKARDRYACRLYATHGSGPLAEILPKEGIACRAYRRQSRLDFRLLTDLARQMRADGIRLVHTHHIGQLLYGGIAGRLVGGRIVHTEHEYYTLSRRRTQRLLRALATLADRVTAVAEPVATFLHDRVGIPAGKIITIPNGVQLDRFRSATPAQREAFGWSQTDPVIGCVARLEPEKGHRVLLEAFREVRARIPTARLLLVGDGAERPHLVRMAESWQFNGAIRFLGTRDDIPDLLATCDVVALPSYNEGMPMALLEAMAAARPVVASAVGGVPELVRPEETGLLVPAGDPVALSQALERMLKDEAGRKRLATNAFEQVARRFSFDSTLHRYEALYDDVLCNRNRSKSEVRL